MREAVRQLLRMGPLPPINLNLEDESLDGLFNRYADLLNSIERPVTDEEAKTLLTLFDPDDAGEIVWTIIHLVETAPSWPMRAHLESLPESEWVEVLKQRAIRGGIWD